MTPIPEIIFSGFVSKAVNDIVDISKDKIKKAVTSENTKYQNQETQIYGVIVDVLNKITRNQYEGSQDKIFDAAEILLKSFKKNEGNKLENIKSCLCILGLEADKNGCLEFKVSLYQELGRDEYGVLFRAILLLLLGQKNQYDYVVYEQLNQKLDEVNIKIDELDQKLDDIHKKQDDTIIQDKIVKFRNNKKQKYIKKWNSRMFLHMDDNENPITLKEAFIVPRFDYCIKVGSIKFSDCDLLTEAIEKFIQYDKTSNLLITGSPGIGKTSIISWIADKYKDDDDTIILRFRDWSNKDLAKGLFNAICNSLDCESLDLENKVLIIDGFDEIKSVNERKSLIQEFLNNTLDFDNLKVIITSRPDYLDIYDFQNAYKILPFSISQIKEFYQIVIGGELDQEKIDSKNLDVLGIPVILYMAIMTDIDLTLKTTKPELYNQIFAERGGIFDRFCFKGISYDGGFQPLRDKKNVKIYLEFLRQAAFLMFEKNELVLAEKEYDIPELVFQGDKFKVVEFPIKPFFESDGGNIEFMHKSIYDYFVSEYIFNSIMEEIDASEERIAEIFGKMFKKGFMLKDILEFLRSKISNSQIKDKFVLFNDTFNLMLQYGMTYYTREHYKNNIDCEMNIFANMLQIIHLWKSRARKFNNKILDYIKSNKRHILNLDEIDLSESNLERVGLERSSAVAAILREANFGRADLRNIDLRGADLKFVNFSYANLFNANLANSILIEADLRRADLTKANLSRAKINASIWYKDDISKILTQLRSAEFTYIIVEDQEQKKLYRSVLFSE